MTDKDKSLVVAEDDQQPEEENIGGAMGGFQALILFAAIALIALIVYAFPMPFNPAVTPRDTPVAAVIEPSPTVDEAEAEATAAVAIPTQDAAGAVGRLLGTEVTEETETVDEAAAATDEDLVIEVTEDLDADTDEAVAAAPTEAATEAPTEIPTEEPTLPPTFTPTQEPEPTATPTEVSTEEMTEEPMEEPTAEAEVAAAAGEDFDAVIAQALEAGDPAHGQELFNQQFQTASGPWICASCHSVDESRQRLVGPPLYNLHELAVTRLEETGQPDPISYIHNSILKPMDYIVPAPEGEPAYPENLMPQNYGDLLSEQDLADLTAYLLTLGNPNAS